VKFSGAKMMTWEECPTIVCFLTLSLCFFFCYNTFRFKGKNVDVVLLFRGDAKGNDEPL
jgi:hypothetical protein